MRLVPMIAVTLALPTLASAQIIASYQPVSGGGVSRASQLWQDPGPNGNDLDGDAVCWTEFVLTAPASINHIEWWGTGASELGFQIEFWPQDPNTIAYQPLGVFYYGGNHNIRPTARFQTTSYTTTAGPGGILHHSLDLATPVLLPPNDAGNRAMVHRDHRAHAPGVRELELVAEHGWQSHLPVRPRGRSPVPGTRRWACTRAAEHIVPCGLEQRCRGEQSGFL